MVVVDKVVMLGKRENDDGAIEEERERKWVQLDSISQLDFEIIEVLRILCYRRRERKKR